MTQTISNGNTSGSASGRAINNSKDVGRKIPLTDLATADPDEDAIPGQLGTDDIADAAVTAAKIGTGAVVAAKIGTGAVETAKIADDGVTEAKIDANIQLSRAQIAMDTTSPPTPTAGNGFVVGSGNEGLVAQLASPGMAVRVQTGGTAYNHVGAQLTIPTSASLAIAAADATNARKDIVVLTAAGALAVRTGTPAGSPADPTLTAGDVPLARVNVAALQADVQTANIDDLRVRGGLDGTKLRGGSVALSKVSTSVKPKSGTFAGRNGTGAITLTGAAIGDRVWLVQVYGDVSDHLTRTPDGAVTAGGQAAALFEATITVANQIQQASATDLSDNKYLVILIPAAA